MSLPRSHREKSIEKWTKGDWIDEANAQREDKEAATTRLLALLEAGEALVGDMAHGSFTDEPFRDELARARLHLVGWPDSKRCATSNGADQ